jgi:hypothetical protein
VLPLQQPAGHELASQTHWPLVLLHSCPAAHAPHDAPPTPHAALVSEPYGTQVLPLQQPLGHEVASQMHWPAPLHSWVAAHGAHAAPALPHDVFDSLLSASQVPALQQPGHDVPPHEQAPPAHACPDAHALQATPPAPHRADDCDDCGTHVLPLQQPVAHDDASHTHCPVVVLHSCPVAQAPHVAPPVPHDAVDSEAYTSHVPIVPPLQQPLGQVFALHEHRPTVVSHSALPHAWQAAPPVPHSEADSLEYGTHVLPLQQPFGHDTASHTHCPVVGLHSWPAVHAAHAAPPVPHDMADSCAKGWHLPAAVQQPFGHDVASHTQLPVPSHSRPAAHALHATPAAPQDELVSADGCSHVPPAVQHPAHALPPQVHAPSEHDSVPPQAAHATPPVPHALLVCEVKGTHAPVALQHPLGHEVGLHAHCPVAVSQAAPAGHAAQLAPAAPQVLDVSEA